MQDTVRSPGIEALLLPPPEAVEMRLVLFTLLRRGGDFNPYIPDNYDGGEKRDGENKEGSGTKR